MDIPNQRETVGMAQRKKNYRHRGIYGRRETKGETQHGRQRAERQRWRDR
jgi:hypothetical protein